MLLLNSLIASNARRLAAQRYACVLSRNVSLKSVKPPEACTAETHDERNKRMKRPLSPHLQIYQIQLTSLLSVSHRGTGILLTLYAAGIASVPWLAGDVTTAVAAIHSLGIPAPILFILKAGFAYPFTFHFANGIRHLVWDMGRALTIKGVYSTGYTVVISSAILAVILACL